MSIANLITLFRGALLAPTLVLLFHGDRSAASALFGLACAGDILDGIVARARNEVTPLGKALDPIIDKSIYVGLLSALLVLGDVPVWAFAAFFAPQAALGLGALLLLKRARTVQAARPVGKAASFVSFVGLFFLLIGWPGGREIFYAAIGATYVAGVDYAWSAARLVRRGP